MFILFLYVGDWKQSFKLSQVFTHYFAFRCADGVPEDDDHAYDTGDTEDT